MRYTIYFGMGDRDDGQVQAVEDYVVSEMERNGYGYNLERVTGGYSDNGVPMKDRVTLKFITTDRDPDVIRDIIDGTKDMFGISAVFLEKDLVDYSFC